MTQTARKEGAKRNKEQKSIQKKTKQKQGRGGKEFRTNLVSLLQASRGDGKEAMALVSPYYSLPLSRSDALSLALGSAVMVHLSSVRWLSKDVIWIALDARGVDPAAALLLVRLPILCVKEKKKQQQQSVKWFIERNKK